MRKVTGGRHVPFVDASLDACAPFTATVSDSASGVFTFAFAVACSDSNIAAFIAGLSTTTNVTATNIATTTDIAFLATPTAVTTAAAAAAAAAAARTDQATASSWTGRCWSLGEHRLPCQQGGRPILQLHLLARQRGRGNLKPGTRCILTPRDRFDLSGSTGQPAQSHKQRDIQTTVM
jgi:hypothetical protein